ncbi:MAG: hypothetical protein WDO73_18845 [Ignavibacteriota bacterium]
MGDAASAIAAIRLAAFTYWGDSYWGGALAVLGGALLFGALPRIIRTSRPRDALLAALGVAILANTRLTRCSLYCGRYIVRSLECPAIASARDSFRPILAVLVCTAAFMAYYNWRVFGSPHNIAIHPQSPRVAVAPVYLFQSPGPTPVYRHKEMRDFYLGWELAVFQHGRTRQGFAEVAFAKVFWIWSFFVGPALTLPLLAFPTTWKSRRTKILLLAVVLPLLGNAVVPFFQPHYLAAATVVFYAMLIQGCGH